MNIMQLLFFFTVLLAKKEKLLTRWYVLFDNQLIHRLTSAFREGSNQTTVLTAASGLNGSTVQTDRESTGPQTGPQSTADDKSVSHHLDLRVSVTRHRPSIRAKRSSPLLLELGDWSPDSVNSPMIRVSSALACWSWKTTASALEWTLCWLVHINLWTICTFVAWILMTPYESSFGLDNEASLI